MAEKKIVFVAFAIEDEWSRNHLKGQSLVDVAGRQRLETLVGGEPAHALEDRQIGAERKGARFLHGAGGVARGY
jgi:hypothetical protein